MRFSDRSHQIAPFHVMDILARARQMQAQGRDIIHLEVGEPDFATPEPIVRGGQAALNQGHTFYTAALGLPALRAAIADWYGQRFGVNVAAERIVITPGASGALLLALAALVNPGDTVLLSDPGYPCNRHLVETFGGRVEAIPVGAEQGFQLGATDIAQHPNARAALVATPGNPSGMVTSLAELGALAEACRAQGTVLLVDEIYQGLNYGAPACTAAALGEDVWIINSFSKFFQMTGWRLGWLVAPEAAGEVLDRLMQNYFLAAATPAQYAALAAFTPETLAILEQRRQQLDQRRQFLLRELPRLGFTVAGEPQGAFYIYANSAALGADSQVLCERWLQEAGVALTPGLDFGSHGCREHVRFSYTQGLGRLEEALQRLAGNR